jgi:hypothetical protein
MQKWRKQKFRRSRTITRNKKFITREEKLKIPNTQDQKIPLKEVLSDLGKRKLLCDLFLCSITENKAVTFL